MNLSAVEGLAWCFGASLVSGIYLLHTCVSVLSMHDVDQHGTWASMQLVPPMSFP